MRFMQPLEARWVLSAGQPDMSLSGTGVLLGAVSDLPDGFKLNAAATAPDGKILLAGSSGDNAVIIRLNEDGTRDTSFGDKGVEQFSDRFFLGPSNFNAVAVAPSGQIYAAGNTAGSTAEGNSNFGLLLSLNANGSIAFQRNGEDPGYEGLTCKNVILSPDGDVVVMASTDAGGNVITAFNSRLQTDKSFGYGGDYAFDKSITVSNPAIQPLPASYRVLFVEDSIIGGDVDVEQVGAVQPAPPMPTQGDPRPILDKTFGDEGSIDFSGATTTAGQIGVSQDGSFSIPVALPNNDEGVVRFLKDGHVDSTFNLGDPLDFDHANTPFFGGKLPFKAITRSWLPASMPRIAFCWIEYRTQGAGRYIWNKRNSRSD